MKPYYEDDAVTLYHGDCRVLASDLRPDVLITDPPYGFGAYETDVAPTPMLLRALVHRSRTAAIFGYPEELVAWCVDEPLAPDEWVTWWPTNKPSARGVRDRLPRETEHIAIFGETPGARDLKRPRSPAGTDIIRALPSRTDDPEEARLGDIWRDASPGVMFNSHLRLHPNEKPMSLMHRLVTLCSRPGDLILDPFAGSGTTLRAAKDLGRRAVGIEICEEHCITTVARLGQEVLDVERPFSLRCPVCGMDTSDPEHRAWACEAMLEAHR